MEPSLKKLFSLLNVLCILFTTTRANSEYMPPFVVASMIHHELLYTELVRATVLLNSSDKHILSYNYSSLWSTSVHSQKGEHSPTSKGSEIYLTSPWLTTVVPSVYILVVVYGFPLNVMAVLVFVVKIKLKKPAVVYMINLASADLLLVSVLPFKIFYHFTGNNWPFGPEMCRFASGIFFCNTFCSMLLMTAISVDRSLALLYPMQSLSWRTLHCASLVCTAIWLVAIAAVIYPMTNEITYNIPQLNITTCLDEPDASVIMTFSRYYISVLSILFFFVPLLISSVCYASIIKKLSSSDVATKPGKKRRAILLSAAVLSSFVLCFGPMNTLSFVQIALPDTYFDSLSLAYNLAFSFSTINCCLDPLIYYYASSECQRQVWTLLCPGKRSDVEKDIQETSNNATTYFSGLGHLTQA